MIPQQYIDALEDMKLDLKNSLVNVCEYHKVDEAKLYYSEQNIEFIFDWLIELYKQDVYNDKTTKKALIIDMANEFSEIKVPILTNWMHQSPIEFLLYSALKITMPSYIWEKGYLMPQVPVCDGKHILDIALMERRDPIKDGTEGVPIVGIECDGFIYHYSEPDQATKTQGRIRNIIMDTGIMVFSYTGKEIYNDCTRLACEFWDYVEKNIYPLEYSNSEDKKTNTLNI